MNNIKIFLKGIIVGMGAIAPGISGSVLMIILGLYTQVINAVATLFKKLKENLMFLIPIGIGMILGIVLFSRLINHAIGNYEIQARLGFLGLLLGSIPLFYREVKKEGEIKRNHYIMMAIAFTIGLSFLIFPVSLSTAGELNIFQNFILGFVGISAMIVPGISGVTVLAALGLYENWLELTSLSNINLAVYIPAGIGVLAGGFILAKLVNTLIKRRYTATFSVLFGLFLSIIPTILRNADGNFVSLENNSSTYYGIGFLIIGILATYFFGKFIHKER